MGRRKAWKQGEGRRKEKGRKEVMACKIQKRWRTSVVSKAMFNTEVLAQARHERRTKAAVRR
jgi:hypothetical protein